jgi:hypothetical protein
MRKSIVVLFVVMLFLLTVVFQGIVETVADETQGSPPNDMVSCETSFRTNYSIYAGVSLKKITPNLEEQGPIYLAGFDRNRLATGVHDDLWSRCCCLGIHGTTIAIVSVDLIGIMYPEYQSILAKLPKDVDIDLVVLTSTHNHEGPDVIGLWGSKLSTGVNWGWYQEALGDIAESIVQAYETMQPAGIRFGHGEATGLSDDSRDPQCIDDQVESLQIVNQNETALATLVFYGTHAVVLGGGNTLITADFPQYLCECIEARVGGTAIFVVGAEGGHIIPKVEHHTFEDALGFGEAIANISLASLQSSSILWDTKIRTETRELVIPLTNPMLRLASFVGMVKRPRCCFGFGVPSAVSVIELGENGSLAQIVSVPGEDFPENWLELKEKLHAEHRILIGMGLDMLGYIVPYEDFHWGQYEESMSASKFLDPLVHGTLEKMLTILDE